jgi:hypothetical protein
MGEYLCWTLDAPRTGAKKGFVLICVLLHTPRGGDFIGSLMDESKLLASHGRRPFGRFRMASIFCLRLEPARISSVGVCRGGP